MLCPFCDEGGFDAIGLKAHLLRGWCDAFESVGNSVPPARMPSVPREQINSVSLLRGTRMTAPSQFAEIVASDKALTQSEDGEAMLAAYPSMRHWSALIALVREAR
jgi:hypothetical protein